MSKGSKQKVSFKETVEMDACLKVLGDLCKALKKGTVCLQNGEKICAVSPKGLVRIKIEAEHSLEKEKIAVKMSWPREVKPDHQPQTLKITDELPPESVQEEEEEESGDQGKRETGEGEEDESEPEKKASPRPASGHKAPDPKAGRRPQPSQPLKVQGAPSMLSSGGPLPAQKGLGSRLTSLRAVKAGKTVEKKTGRVVAVRKKTRKKRPR